MNRKAKPGRSTPRKHGGGRVPGSKVINGKVVPPSQLAAATKALAAVATKAAPPPTAAAATGHSVVTAIGGGGAAEARGTRIELSNGAGKVDFQLDPKFVFVRTAYLDGLEASVAKITKIKELVTK